MFYIAVTAGGCRPIKIKPLTKPGTRNCMELATMDVREDRYWSVITNNATWQPKPLTARDIIHLVGSYCMEVTVRIFLVKTRIEPKRRRWFCLNKATWDVLKSITFGFTRPSSTRRRETHLLLSVTKHIYRYTLTALYSRSVRFDGLKSEQLDSDTVKFVRVTSFAPFAAL